MPAPKDPEKYKEWIKKIGKASKGRPSPMKGRNPKIAVECDGCYWHGCQEHYPDSKFVEKAKIRDGLIDRCMKELGIKVIRLWEHDIKKGNIPIELYLGVRQ